MYTGTAGKAWFTSSVHPFPLIFFFSGFTMTSMQHAGCGSVSADLQTMKTCQLSGLYHFSLLRRRGKGRCQTVQQLICFLSEILTLPFFRLQPFCVSQRTPLLGCARAHTHTQNWGGWGKEKSLEPAGCLHALHCSYHQFRHGDE